MLDDFLPKTFVFTISIRVKRKKSPNILGDFFVHAPSGHALSGHALSGHALSGHVQGMPFQSMPLRGMPFQGMPFRGAPPSRV